MQRSSDSVAALLGGQVLSWSNLLLGLPHFA